MRQQFDADIQFRAQDPQTGRELLFDSTWGLFSPEALDEGSRMLLEWVHVGASDAILDVGCGYGAIGLFLAARAPEGRVHAVDKDFVAVEYATRNAAHNHLPHVTAYLSNGLAQVAEDVRFDCIVSNLPGKVGRELLHRIIQDSYSHLKPGGQFCVVTITGLREFIRRECETIFGNYEKVKQGSRYTVARAVRQ